MPAGQSISAGEGIFGCGSRPLREVFLSEVGMKSVLRRIEHVAAEWGGRVLAPADGDSLLVGPATSL